MLKDFKAFILRGNVLDLAVAVVIGAAFGAVVKSLTDDVIMPPIGLALGHIDFSNLFVVLKEGTKAAGPVRDGGASARGGRGDAQLRDVHQLDRHLPHHRALRVHDRADGEQAVREARAAAGQHEVLPALYAVDPEGRDALPELHVGRGRG